VTEETGCQDGNMVVEYPEDTGLDATSVQDEDQPPASSHLAPTLCLFGRHIRALTAADPASSLVMLLSQSVMAMRQPLCLSMMFELGGLVGRSRRAKEGRISLAN
jgi:hypothetical protein